MLGSRIPTELRLSAQQPYSFLNCLLRNSCLDLTQFLYDEAEPLYKCALDMRKKALGPHHPDVAMSLIGLAGLRQCQARVK